MREIIENKYSRLDIDTINELALNDPHLLIERSEAYYNRQVFAAAQHIQQQVPGYKFVLLCGPSASGKTTTAHKLQEQLVQLGVGAQVVSMDNFFLGIEAYAKLPSGKPDMESVDAVDMDLLNQCFDELLETGKAMFPTFDFVRQQRTMNCHPLTLGQRDVLIMEGIHALNPMVLNHIPEENIFRIYVSVRTKFINGDETVLAPKDIRLMRRMVRDSIFRSYSPIQTLEHWGNVLEGERKNIDPYRDEVDLKMDNTIDYEVCVWHELLQHHLYSSFLMDYESYPEIKRILDGLPRFHSVDHLLIPQNSLLREFIGH